LENIKKKRENSYIVEMHATKAMQEKIKNRIVAVVDDLVETGGTLDRCYDECKRVGAKEVVALITHGVLAEGISRVQKKYAKLYLTNTINRLEANVDITPLIAKSLLH
jgi:phosphoribosylpyrophosphate synthetase